MLTSILEAVRIEGIDQHDQLVTLPKGHLEKA